MCTQKSLYYHRRVKGQTLYRNAHEIGLQRKTSPHIHAKYVEKALEEIHHKLPKNGKAHHTHVHQKDMEQEHKSWKSQKISITWMQQERSSSNK